MKRDRRGGRRGGDHLFGVRRKILLTVLAMGVTAGAAMGMVWLNVQATSTWLRYENARRTNEKLVSDLNANRLKLLGKIRLADLDPSARERLGMTDPSVDDMHLVRFHPSLDNETPATAGLIDRIVPPVSAASDWTVSGPRRAGTRSGLQGRR